jgi:heterodisulfide reductase subunit B
LRHYTYFPGCSASEGGAKAYNWSAKAVSQALEVDLTELEDWNCCGSTPSGAVDELGAYCMAARDLAMAEKIGLEMVTPCSACHVIFNRTNTYLNGYPKFKARVNEALAAGGLEYHGTLKVRHLLDVLTTDIGYEAIASRVKKTLSGLKVAPYYGCQVVRPKFGFDHPERPQSLDKLVASLGAVPVPFPLKASCCGGSLIISEEDVALGLIHKLMESARSHGAECLVTVCPLCQTNLDAYQSRVNKKFKTDYKLPVFFFTQLMGLAFGIEEKTLGFDTNIVSPREVLNHIYNPITYMTTHKGLSE